MADYKRLVPFVLSHEGGFVNNRHDHGGATNMGITLATWKKVGYDIDHDGDIDVDDLKKLGVKDFERVFKRNFWDRWHADSIVNQSVADILVDWLWASGRYGISLPQTILHVQSDGIVGDKTVHAVNSANQHRLFDDIKARRILFTHRIVQSDPSQRIFLNGWLKRINDLTFQP